MKAPSSMPLPAEIVSADDLWAMKHQSQERDRLLVASGAIEPEAMLFLRPAQFEGMQIEWPACSLKDDWLS